jgi:hypothetical protein
VIPRFITPLLARNTPAKSAKCTSIQAASSLSTLRSSSTEFDKAIQKYPWDDLQPSGNIVDQKALMTLGASHRCRSGSQLRCQSKQQLHRFVQCFSIIVAFSTRYSWVLSPRSSRDVSGSWSQAGTSHDLARANTSKIGIEEHEPPEPGKPRDLESLKNTRQYQSRNLTRRPTARTDTRHTSYPKPGSLTYQEILHFPSEDRAARWSNIPAATRMHDR